MPPRGTIVVVYRVNRGQCRARIKYFPFHTVRRRSFSRVSAPPSLLRCSFIPETFRMAGDRFPAAAPVWIAAPIAGPDGDVGFFCLYRKQTYFPSVRYGRPRRLKKIRFNRIVNYCRLFFPPRETVNGNIVRVVLRDESRWQLSIVGLLPRFRPYFRLSVTVPNLDKRSPLTANDLPPAHADDGRRVTDGRVRKPENQFGSYTI